MTEEDYKNIKALIKDLKRKSKGIYILVDDDIAKEFSQTMRIAACVIDELSSKLNLNKVNGSDPVFVPEKQ